MQSPKVPGTSAESASRNQIIGRSPGGTLGKKVTLLSNNFKIDFKKPSLKIFQFELAIVDKNREELAAVDTMTSKFVCQKVYEQLKLGPKWAYDGTKNLYSPSDKNMNTIREMSVGTKSYKVTAKGPVASTSVQEIYKAMKEAGGVVPISAVNALKIVLSQGFKNGSYVTIKRNFFDESQLALAPNFPGGLKLYSGVSASIIPTMDFGITIRILKTHQVMYPGGPLLDFMESILNDSKSGASASRERGNHRSSQPLHLDPIRIKYFDGVLRGLKVVTNHLGYERTYTITGVHSLSANRTIIKVFKEESYASTSSASANKPDSDKEYYEKSVAQYFKDKHLNRDLTYPDLPLVKAGGETKLPIELCTLRPNQPFYRALDIAQQQNMIRQACQKPFEKMKDIRRSSQEVSEVTSKFTLSNYGFEINPKAIELRGRVLTPPKMDEKHDVERGAWTMSAVKLSGSIPELGEIKLGFVGLLPKHNYDKKLHEKFLDFLLRRATTLGINILGGNPPLRYSTIGKLEETVVGMKSNYNIIILDNSNSDSIYGKVKLTELWTRRTQCIKLQTIKKICGVHLNRNMMDNILKKLNAKFRGVNFGVTVKGLPKEIFGELVMIVGADVTHFTRSDQKPSIAAVVATCDPTATRYISRVKALYPEGEKLSVEYIRDMKSVMVGILKEFWQKNRGALPQKIIYYRDGVSEGQFENTVMEELGGIQDACMEAPMDYKPRISVVVCTKRHRQRFIVKQQNGKLQNMEPGTVVDSGVVSPNYMDFYLNSQQAIQGTSVPCHYYVLYDDSKLTMDLWQMLSFFLCHTYARCSRSVSYPAPVYYAHRACESARARMLSAFNWQEITSPENRPSEEEIEKISRPDKFNMFFI